MSMRFLLAGLILAALPTSNNFKLNSYGFGTGGTAGSASGNYRINGIAGDTAGSGSSSHYKVGAGETYAKQADVPTATLTNSGSWYNKLLLTLGSGGNPTDALYAVAISTNNFTTTQYVKSDGTIGSSLAFSDYRTLASWGGAGGVYISGLTRSTVYTVKAKAYRGKFTESPYGPTSSATTADPQLSFDIDVSATDTQTSPPYAISFGSLLPNVVVDSPQRIWVSLDTNGESGGKVYLSGQNGGLYSTASAYTISSLTGDISTSSEGFGVQGQSATQTQGGPLAITSPYDGTGQTIGTADSVIRQIFSSSVPITGGRGSLLLKAKAKPLTPASADYTEVLTMIAAASF